MVKIPFTQIAQSIICGPAVDNHTLVFNVKVLPPNSNELFPFFGIWLLDTSGSMSGLKFDSAVESLIEQVNTLPKGTVFSLVGFGPVRVIFNQVEIDQSTRTKIIAELKNLSANGGTPMQGALDEAFKILRSFSGELSTRKLILITDGFGDVSHEKAEEIAKLALKFNASIDCVGALNDHDVELLHSLARLSSGKYIFAQDAAELKKKMIIATRQSTQIIFSLPRFSIFPKLGTFKILEAVQIKPTIISVPFEKKADHTVLTVRSFEAGDTYEFIIKMEFHPDMDKIILDQPQEILEFNFDFGKPSLQLSKIISMKFSHDTTKFRLNKNIINQCRRASLMIVDITEATKRHDPKGTIMIQGDETQKVNT